MAIVDDRGRLGGKVNLIDAVVAFLILILIPVAFGAYLLFRTPQPTLWWLLLCPLLLAGCVGNADPPPVPRIPAPARLLPPIPVGPHVVGEGTAKKPVTAPPQGGGFLLPSKYMLMTPPNNSYPDRPPQYRAVPMPQGVNVVQEPGSNTKSR